MTVKSIEQFIVALGTLAVALIVFLVADPVKAQNLAILITGTVIPMLCILAGVIFVWIKGQQNVAESKVELAKLNLQTAQLRGSGSRGANTTTSDGYTYTIKDVEIVLGEAIADIKSGNIAVDPINTSQYDYTHMANYDLRPVAKEKRVVLSKAFLEKNLNLLDDAWKYATNIPTSPTPEQAANKTTNMYYFKKEYNKYNPDNPCGQNSYDVMSSLLGYFNNVYAALAGIDSLIGVTVDYSTFGSSMYSPTILGWEAANCVV